LCSKIDSELVFFTGLIEMPGNSVRGTGFIAADMTLEDGLIGISYISLTRIAFRI
jgi:hypothetical protein